ncbi:DUF4145 domain-containing protein [Pseudomonas sp. PDM16]|uniref:DUF4145 domain-containing protein n=1 Tax=Pseudomonas sp. PDM16 TaxID=2769292 RepID=UPI00177B677E|nr:DUF4145 domain-containing protein [Pseudomonas sp. PDM16]MBD9415879.1 DUF4145 domain-containing protein [Pseudomonas sp. PDM16]
MDSLLFKTSFHKEHVPSYRCPCCQAATMSAVDMHVTSTEASTKDMKEYWWDPTYVVHVFRLSLKCSACEELVFVQGDGYVEEEYEVDGEGGWNKIWHDYLSPKYFFPPLKFVVCPPKTPDAVVAHLESASALYYSHPAACCNSLRMAAEGVLTFLGVPESPVGAFVSLGTRIKSLDPASNEYTLLDAIRWLGNEGSHSGSRITHKDAEDAFQIFSFLVEECFSERRKEIQELAAAIREHKGPVRRSV